MKNKEKGGIISKMINYTKKWWLLGCHRRAEKFYSVTRNSSRSLIAENFFIEGGKEGDKNYKGLIHKYNPFIRFRLSHLIFWEKEYSEEQLRVKKHIYYNLYEICVKEGYITKEKHKKDGKEVEYPTVANDKAYNISGFFPGYFSGLFLTYNKVWIAIGALIVALIGSRFFIDNQPQIIINPSTNTSVTPPEINVSPVINVYPK